MLGPFQLKILLTFPMHLFPINMSGLFAISFPMFTILGFKTKINVGLHDLPMKKKEFCNEIKINLRIIV